VKDYQSYRFEGVLGVAPFLAVVAGILPGNCNLPAGANAAHFVGFTTDSLTAAQVGQAIPVVRGSRCWAVAAGAIAHGNWVQIADALGRVSDCQAAVDLAPGAALNTNVIGKAETDAAIAGDVVYVTTQEFVAKTAVT
jgi:hypothetical protein